MKTKGHIPWNKGTKGVCKPNKTSFKKGQIPKTKTNGTRACLICDTKRHYKPVILKRGGGNYCSMRCFGISTRGRTSPKKGKEYPQIQGINHPAWKGDSAGYVAVHSWIKRKLGKAISCANCQSSKNIQWANISFNYKRDINDWEQLCASCHSLNDRELGWGERKKIFNDKGIRISYL